MSDFFNKQNFFEKKDFLDLNQNRKSSTVMVQMLNGEVKEYPNITNPWQYINKCKKNPDVKNAWIKNE
jgi:hypothetical protein